MAEVITKSLNTTEEIQGLLNEVAKITDKYNTIAQATGSNFNMFEIMNVAENEVRMCRILADLLNPNGTHLQGRIYLDLFFENVLKLPLPCEPINIEREFVIDKNRRIDILIKDSTRIIPIEAKINAGDQPNQLYDYSKKSKNASGAKVYYLTKFGTDPSENSCCSCSNNEKLKIENIGCISWEYDILKWLDACISHYNTYTRAPIREILIQFAAVIRKFTEQLEENEQMEIQELLLKTPENMKNAYVITAALENAELKLWHQFCNEVKRTLGTEYGIIPYREPDNWNIIYNLNETNEELQTYVWINADKKKEIKKLSDKELFSSKALNEGSFSISKLTDKENFNAIVQDCTEWVAGKSNSTTID